MTTLRSRGEQLVPVRLLALLVLAIPLACGQEFTSTSTTSGTGATGASGTGATGAGGTGATGAGGTGATGAGGTGGQGAAGGTTAGGNGGQGGGTPSNCDPAAGPIDPACNGIYVSASLGDDTAGDGSMANPYRSFDTAMQHGSRIYACGELFHRSTSQVIGQRVEIYGGLDCSNGWAYPSASKTVFDADPDVVPLRIESGASNSALHDVDSRSLNAVTPGGSSIAVVIDGATGVSFTRGTLRAGDGMAGPPGPSGSPAPTHGATGFQGHDGCGAGDSVGGEGATLACQGGSSAGGKGGNGGAAQGGSGAAGTAIPSSPVTQPNGGAGGLNSGFCLPGALGGHGGLGANAAAAQGQPVLDGTGAHGLHGAPGQPGTPGQGGGGGGAQTGQATCLPTCSGCSGPGGGGGGSGGGCGPGGGGGLPGGSSVAVLLLGGASVSFDHTVDIIAGKGGHGGQGADGADGADGGAGGPGGAGAGGTVGCLGGTGGRGGRGGGGGGGQGGFSIGVAYLLGDPGPNLNTAAVATGTPGAGGIGGSNGSQSAPSGSPGVAQQTMAF